MILANGTNPAGRPIVLIGITVEEMTDLIRRPGAPLRIGGADIGYDVEFLVMAGATDDTMLARLRAEGVIGQNSTQRTYTDAGAT